KRLLVGEAYKSSVHRRVTDQVYDENVYKLDDDDWFLVPLAFKVLRAGARLLASDSIELGVSIDHPELRDAILKEDLKNSLALRDGFKEVLPKLLSSSNYFKVDDPKSYQTVDFSILSQPIILSVEEQLLQKRLAFFSGEIPKWAFGAIPEERWPKALQRVQ